MAERGRHPGGDLQRHRAGHAARGGRAASRSAPASPPRTGKASSFKLWLKYAKPTPGRIVVDDGAARVLRESGSSLLPVGIVEVDGELRGRRRGRGRAATASRSARGSPTTPPRELAPGDRDEDRRGPRACCRTPPTRSSTATASSCSSRACEPAGLPQLPLSDGRDHDQSVAEYLRRREARGARAGERVDRGQERGAGGDRAAARGAHRRRSSRRTPPTSPTSAPPGLTEALRDRLALTPERVAAMADGRAGRSPRSTTRSARSSNARRWPAASTCARSGCRSGSSPSSTRRGRT